MKLSHLAGAALLAVLNACTLNSPMPSRAPVSESSSGTAANTPAIAPVATSSKPLVAGPNQYLVQKGDTLYSIGKKLGIPYKKLAELNRLETPYAIHTGQLLNLSNTNAATASTGAEDAEVVTATISQPGVTINDKSLNTSDNQAPENTTATAKPAAASAGSKPAASASVDVENVNDSNLQWQWPLSGKVSAGFDPQNNKGLNIAGAPGQAVVASSAGKVIYSGMDIRGYGRLIIIKHSSNLLTVYAHQGTSLLKEGSFVAQGDKIATLPASASSLHFEIRLKGKPVDPASYLPASPASNG